jgi:transposase
VYVIVKPQTREQLIELCRNKPEQAADLLIALIAANNDMEARIQKLEERLNQNSHNSNSPPSSDGYKRINRPVRTKSNRSRGGQTGHLGTTLKMVGTPDEIVNHTVSACGRCGRSLRREKMISYQRRQILDIPDPSLQVTEHQCETKICRDCGSTTTASFPDGITKSIQYGKNLKSFAMYLRHYQLIPSHRLREAMRDLFGCLISEGTFFDWDHDLYNALEQHEKGVKEQLKLAPVIHVDETGLFCEQKLNWLHGTSTPELTHYHIHAKRGTAAMNDIGILPEYHGVAVHDFWKPYLTYDCKHALCNAHLIRELDFIAETTQFLWASQIKNLLLHIHETVQKANLSGTPEQQRFKTLNAPALRSFKRRYNTLVSDALRSTPCQRSLPHKRGRTKQSKARNLAERLSDHRQAVLAFMHDFQVPFTNNQAERDIRMMKVKQKISGTFRSRYGAEIFCRVRGYLSTSRKNGFSAFDALSCAFNGNPFVPKIIYAE